MTNEELLNTYEIAIAILVTRPEEQKEISEERLRKIREEILRRMK